MPPQPTLQIYPTLLTNAVSDQSVLKHLEHFGFQTVGQFIDALAIEVLTTDLGLLRVWREDLHCQCVGDVRRLERRDFEHLPIFGLRQWERTNAALRAHGLPEIEDDPVSANKVQRFLDRVSEETLRSRGP